MPGANLTRALCHHTNFEGANLRGVNLFQAQLVRANLNKADLTGISLGQLPQIVADQEVWNDSIHPTDNKVTLILKGGDGFIVEIWDRLQAKKLSTFKCNSALREACLSQDGNRLVLIDEKKTR